MTATKYYPYRHAMVTKVFLVLSIEILREFRKTLHRQMKPNCQEVYPDNHEVFSIMDENFNEIHVRFSDGLVYFGKELVEGMW